MHHWSKVIWHEFVTTTMICGCNIEHSLAVTNIFTWEIILM